MQQLRLFVLFLAITALLFVWLGLYRPRIVLWWEDVQNRRKVLRIYGVIAFAAFVLYLMLGLF